MDYAVVIGANGTTETLAAFDELGPAVVLWRKTKRARIWRMTDHQYHGHEAGALYSAIKGDALVRTHGDRRARSRVRRDVVVGWNRLVPTYRGVAWWRLTTRERKSLFPKLTIVGLCFAGEREWRYL